MARRRAHRRRRGRSPSSPRSSSSRSSGAAPWAPPPAAASQAFPFAAQLVDLRLARPQASALAEDTQITSHGTILGTPSTMAPEQFDDPDGVDFRADIYGLGCVLFYVLTGQPAFSERT